MLNCVKGMVCMKNNIDFIIGIDPGLKGGVCIIDQDGLCVDETQMPIGENGVDALALYEFIFGVVSDPSRAVALVEKAQSMSKQGVVSTFTYGTGYGKLLAVLEVLEIDTELIRPTIWKKHFALIKKTKKDSVELAEELFPDVVLRTKRGRLIDGVAEALMIAEYKRGKIV